MIMIKLTRERFGLKLCKCIILNEFEIYFISYSVLTKLKLQFSNSKYMQNLASMIKASY